MIKKGVFGFILVGLAISSIGQNIDLTNWKVNLANYEREWEIS